MIAIIGSIVGAYVMSIETIERDVIVYEPLTPITELYDTERLPEFIEYNPSNNYTGYYTDDPSYFSGVDFKKSSTPNNYRIITPPITIYNGSVNLASLDLTTPQLEGTQVVYAFLYGNDLSILADNSAHVSTLASLLNDPLVQGANEITIISNGDAASNSEMNPYTRYDAHCIFFTPAASWNDGYAVGTTEYFERYDLPINVGTYTLPLVAARVNMTLGTVYLYSDVEMTQELGPYTIDTVYLAWGGSETGNYQRMNLDTSVKINAAASSIEFMDPSSGVSVHV